MAKLTLFFKGRPIDVYHIENDVVQIGRDPHCQIQIDSLAVSPYHAQIVRENENYFVLSLETDHPVLLNHKPVSEQELAHGDVIQIGKHTLNFADDVVELNTLVQPDQEQIGSDTSDDEPTDSDIDVDAGCIQILSGEHLGRVIPLDRSMIRLGRAGRECAIIAHRQNGYYLSHLEGPHSPVVNGRPIGNQSMRLHDGSVIEIGATRMQFYAKLA